MYEGGAGGGKKACNLRKELGDLERMERSLDELIHSSTTQLKQMTEHEDNQRYPLHAVVWLIVNLPASSMSVNVISAAVLTLDPRAPRWAT